MKSGDALLIELRDARTDAARTVRLWKDANPTAWRAGVIRRYVAGELACAPHWIAIENEIARRLFTEGEAP